MRQQQTASKNEFMTHSRSVFFIQLKSDHALVDMATICIDLQADLIGGERSVPTIVPVYFNFRFRWFV